MIGAGAPVGVILEHGTLLACTVCGATWTGTPGEGCWWCAEAEQRQRDGQRELLLNPSWLDDDTGDPRYDTLEPLDQAIWRRTRGQTRDIDSVEAWIQRLVNAVTSGLVTELEATQAIERVTR